MPVLPMFHDVVVVLRSNGENREGSFPAEWGSEGLVILSASEGSDGVALPREILRCAQDDVSR